MKNIGIKEPCTENWNEMSPSEKGAFCQKCATQVHDFTNKTNEEIRSTLKNLIGQSVCGRITSTQEQTLNAEFEAWQFNSKRSFQSALVFSLIVVFGLTLFSCENEKEKKTIQEIQTIAMSAMVNSVPEITLKSNEEVIGFVAPEIQEIEIIDEHIIMGKMASVVPGFQREEIPEIPKVEMIHDIHMLGGMSWSDSYVTYLEENPVNKDVERDENGNILPNEFASKIYPNPVTTITNLEIAVPKKDRFEISLFDMSGKFIQSIYKGKMERGTFTYQFDMTEFISGSYFVIINSDGYQESIQFVKF